MLAGVNDFSVYGPLPTGCFTGSLAGSAIFSHRCLGTIGTRHSTFCWLTNCGLAIEMVTSLPLAVASVYGTPWSLRAGNFFTRL